MNLDSATVEKLADLSRLEFSEKEKENMLADLNKIVAFVDKINELDLEGVAPLVYLTEEENVLRPDEVKGQVTKDEALKNAPDRDTDYFRVPKVLKREEDD
ncbi:MAG: Asp-tRNA(Asn)/Glu-tRNA(Gln) amidotransferase subunit GatC [Owenweeksia sp.]|nr:Asp-tRNA(Asn)/Glu-tRNA(Gln) amidotransferase subunit GatC [Owenweeksia sp.]